MKITAIFDRQKLIELVKEVEAASAGTSVGSVGDPVEVAWLKRFLDEELVFEGGWPVMKIASLQSPLIHPRIAMAISRYRVEFLAPCGTAAEHRKRESASDMVKKFTDPVAHRYRYAFACDGGKLVEAEIHTIEAGDLLDLKYVAFLVLQCGARGDEETNALDQSAPPGKVNP